MFDAYSVIALGLYFLMIIGIGVWMWRTEGLRDFLIADRKLSSIQAGGSLVASWFDGPLLFTTITIAFASLWGLFWFYAGIVLGLMVYIFYAPRLRNMAAQSEAFTYPTLIYRHIGFSSGVVLSIIGLFTWLALAALQFIVGAQILGQLSGLKYEYGVALIGITIGVYMIMGGFKASVITDIIQISFLLFVCGILFSLGQDVNFENLNTQISFADELKNNIWSTIAVIFAVMFAADGIPRMFASSCEKTAKRSVWVAITGFTILGVFFGYFGFAASIINPDLNPDDVPIWVFTQYLPEQFFPLVLVALFGLIMSSADTYILVAAQTITTDLLSKFGITDKKRPRLNNRYGIVAVTLISIVIAFLYTDIVDFFLYALMFIGIGAPALIALMHNMNKNPHALAISCGFALIAHIVLLIFGGLTEQNSVLVNIANFILWFVLEKSTKQNKA